MHLPIAAREAAFLLSLAVMGAAIFAGFRYGGQIGGFAVCLVVLLGSNVMRRRRRASR